MSKKHEYIRVVFDGPPSHESGRFVEVETEHGNSISFGEWVEGTDGLWYLQFPNPAALQAEVAGMRDKWTPPDEVAALQADNESMREIIINCPECYRTLRSMIDDEHKAWGGFPAGREDALNPGVW
jgi:hypothetical protein